MVGIAATFCFFGNTGRRFKCGGVSKVAKFQMWWHSDGGGGRFPMWAAAFRWWIVVVVNVAGILFFLGVLSVIFKVAAAEFR